MNAPEVFYFLFHDVINLQLRRMTLIFVTHYNGQVTTILQIITLFCQVILFGKYKFSILWIHKILCRVNFANLQKIDFCVF